MNFFFICSSIDKILISIYKRMGNCFISSENDVYSILSRNDFNFLEHIGRGSFGIVWKAEFKPIGIEYAVKEIQKSLIISESAVKSIQNERAILMLVYNPFIVNLHLAFQDKRRLYLMLDLKTGGDLRYHILSNISIRISS